MGGDRDPFGRRFADDVDRPIVDAVQRVAERRGIPMARVALASGRASAARSARACASWAATRSCARSPSPGRGPTCPSSCAGPCSPAPGPDLGLPDTAVGLFFAAGGLGVFLGSLAARRLALRLGAGRVLWLMGLAIAPFGVLVALVDRGPALWLAGAGWLVTTFKVGVDNVLKVSFRQSVTPDRLLGRMNATMRVLLTGALAVGAALSGLLGEFASVRAVLWAGAAGLATVWVPIFFSPLRTHRGLPGPEGLTGEGGSHTRRVRQD
ncbi:hypothetical protein [Kitasatospora camelliae]|uniref:Transmembrane secretion effector n=1 Tax=Kitasatospora camelliae TaxID=3156397 RepID=A0AAU8JRM8_9ACTN